MTARAVAVAALVTVGVTLAGCGDDSEEAGTDATSASDTSAGETSTTETPSTQPPSTSTTPGDTGLTSAAPSAPETTSGEPVASGVTTGETTPTSTGRGGTELTGDEAAVADVYRTLFDSTIPATEKLDFVEGGAELEPTLDEYATAGEMVGGIGLDVTDVSIDAGTATVTYDLTFAGTPQYEGLDGEAVKVDGAWQVPRTEFCDFMGQARVSCP